MILGNNVCVLFSPPSPSWFFAFFITDKKKDDNNNSNFKKEKVWDLFGAFVELCRRQNN